MISKGAIAAAMMAAFAAEKAATAGRVPMSAGREAAEGQAADAPAAAPPDQAPEAPLQEELD